MTSTSNEIMIKADRLGNASASDVVSGKTFTSENGLKITGTIDISGLADLNNYKYKKISVTRSLNKSPEYNMYYSHIDGWESYYYYIDNETISFNINDVNVINNLDYCYAIGVELVDIFSVTDKDGSFIRGYMQSGQGNNSVARFRLETSQDGVTITSGYRSACLSVKADIQSDNCRIMLSICDSSNTNPYLFAFDNELDPYIIVTFYTFS